MQKLQNPQQNFNRNQRNFGGNKPRHPNAMDIDAIRTHPDRRINPSDKQKEALKILGGCFRCGQLGHISTACTKFPYDKKQGWSGGTRSPGSGGRGPEKGNKAQIRTIEEKPRPPMEERPNLNKGELRDWLMKMDPEERADTVEEWL